MESNTKTNNSNQQQKHQEEKFSWRNSLMRASYESATFILTRYPYLCAVLLMVTTAEDAKEKKIVRGSLKYRMAYAHLGAYFFCGTVMSFDLFGLKRFFAVFTCFHLAFVTYTEYTLTYGEQIAYRLLTRNVACIGCYLMVAGGIAKSKREGDRRQSLVSFGRQLLGVYAVLSVVLAWNDVNEYKAYLEHVFKLPAFAYLVLLLQFTLGICLYAGYNVVQFSKYYAILLLGTTVLIDADVEYWRRSSSMKTWNTATVACRHLPVVCALLLIRKGYS